MKIFVAIDSFKGSFSSKSALQTIRESLPQHEVIGYAVSDGGEGFLECLEAVLPVERMVQPVMNSAGETMEASFLWEASTHRAYLEVAATAGFTLTNAGNRNPRWQTSYGVGQQILAALDQDAKEIVVGLGGSATVDGGIGMLAALGVEFFDAHNQPLAILPMDLEKVASISLKNLDKRIVTTKFAYVSDVENPLLGEYGAVYFFGRQKGLLPEDEPLFEKAMTSYSQLLQNVCDRDGVNQKGAGAAGGIGFALATVCQAQYLSGIDYIIEKTQLEGALANCDLVFTGEGRFDQQSLKGKLPIGISRLARKYQKPVILFYGATDFSEINLPEENIFLLMPINEKLVSLDEALTSGLENLAKAAKRVMTLVALDLEQ